MNETYFELKVKLFQLLAEMMKLMASLDRVSGEEEDKVIDLLAKLSVEIDDVESQIRDCRFVMSN